MGGRLSASARWTASVRRAPVPRARSPATRSVPELLRLWRSRAVVSWMQRHPRGKLKSQNVLVVMNQQQVPDQDQSPQLNPCLSQDRDQAQSHCLQQDQDLSLQLSLYQDHNVPVLVFENEAHQLNMYLVIIKIYTAK